MRIKVAITILIIFCFAEITPLLPYLEYCVNYDYISEVLCVEKDKPLSICNGKCYLSQQLKEAQETEEQDKKIVTVEQEKIPMIVATRLSIKYLFPIVNSPQQYEYYRFSVKDLFALTPKPPPKG